MNNILLKYDQSTAILTVNRPASLNALNLSTIRELKECVSALLNKGGIRAFILTGAGEKAFVAGADTKELETLGPEQAKQLSELGSRVFQSIHTLPFPTIAAVNGYALGGGCELALACDIRIASEKAVFGLPETSIGICPGWGGTQRLARIVGYARAAQMVFSGNSVKADEALQIGLVNHVVPAGELLDFAGKLATKIAMNAPLGTAYAKSAMQAGLDVSLEEGLRLETEQFAKLFETEDKTNGLHAFNSREKYNYKGK